MDSDSGTGSLTGELVSIQPHRKRRIIVLEPAVLLVFLASNLSGTVFQNQIIYQSCLSVFKYNQSECVLLGTPNPSAETEHVETEVQPYVANIIMVRSLLESIIPAIGSLFIGPWSDKFGRKPVMLVSFLGQCLSYALIAMISFLSSKMLINPWIYILAVIPSSFSGGFCALITGTLCYITDVCETKERAYRMVLIEASVYIGLMIGTLSSSYILAATNYTTVFAVSALSVFMALLYIVFFVEESLRPEKMDRSSKIRGLFKWTLVRDMFRTCFEKRPNYDRLIIWLIMCTLGISIFTMDGAANVFYLFVREKFEWTIKDYTIYDATSIIIQIFGNVIVVYFLQKVLHMSITSVALVAFGSCVLDSVIKATAVSSWHLYLAIGVSLLKAVGGPMCRAILSNVVSGSDVGKIYSLATSIESITPLCSAPLYTYVYRATLTQYPGAFNFISVGSFFVCYLFLAIVFGIQKSFPEETYAAIGS